MSIREFTPEQEVENCIKMMTDERERHGRELSKWVEKVSTLRAEVRELERQLRAFNKPETTVFDVSKMGRLD